VIHLPRRQITVASRQQLASWQGELDLIDDFRKRVKKAKSKYKYHRSVPGDTTFADVKSTLAEMCHKPRRCMYCEDSLAYQIEHFRPHSIFPEETFVWENLLYSCGSCNQAKLAKFKIITHVSHRIVNVAPRDPRKGRSSRPPTGTALLINPSVDDPLTYIELVMAPTVFTYLPVGRRGSRTFIRGAETIKTLNLNEDFLRDAREGAYDTFKTYLKDYVRERLDGGSQSDLDGIRRRLLQKQYIGVWRQMQRHYRTYPDLVALFAQEPAALTW